MARKYKLNKSELTRLKREEKTYGQFLPVLKLKQEQLQAEQLRVKREILKTEKELNVETETISDLISLLPDPMPIDIVSLSKIKKITLKEKSIAGVRVPIIKEISFSDFEISNFGTPVWLTLGLDALKNLTKIKAEIKILEKQFTLITRELKKSTQKVNLFEKVLIPETKEGVRKIKIALGDEQVAAVGRGKIAKKKQAILSTYLPETAL